MLCGFVRPDGGRLISAAPSWVTRPHRLAALGIARTLQGVGLFRRLTVLESVMVGRRARPGPGSGPRWVGYLVTGTSTGSGTGPGTP